MLNDQPQKEVRRRLRKQLTTGEKLLWLKLRSRRLGNYKFRRQTSIDHYIVDFYCAEKKLIIELDGDVHGFIGQQKYDQERQRHLESLGFTVLRFTNQDVKESMEGVLTAILEYLKNK